MALGKLQTSVVSICSALLCALAVCALTGCTEEAWSRGEPPSTQQLVARGQERLAEAQEKYGATRQKLAPVAAEIEKALLQSYSDSQKENASALAPTLGKLEGLFMQLEGNVSIGSRAALGELSSQLRGFSAQAQKPDAELSPAYGLFTARTLQFLANELSVPAPTF